MNLKTDSDVLDDLNQAIDLLNQTIDIAVKRRTELAAARSRFIERVQMLQSSRTEVANLLDN